MNLLELIFRRRKARQQANALLDKAATEGHNLSVSEQITFDGLLARISELDTAIAARAALRKA